MGASIVEVVCSVLACNHNYCPCCEYRYCYLSHIRSCVNYVGLQFKDLKRGTTTVIITFHSEKHHILCQRV